MILADVSEHVIFLVIAGVAALIRWLSSKSEEEAQQPKSTPKPSAETAKNSEEERMRRFLEALGVPPESHAPPKRAPAPRPATPPPLKEPKHYPVPPIVSRPDFRRTPKAVPVPPPLQPQSLDEQDAPVLPVEQIHIPELRTPELITHPEAEAFHETRSAPLAPSSGPTVDRASSVLSPEQLRQLVRSPAELRAAIILREILGPPRSLQSSGPLLNLP
jgi:hypothetical protein